MHFLFSRFNWQSSFRNDGSRPKIDQGQEIHGPFGCWVDCLWQGSFGQESHGSRVAALNGSNVAWATSKSTVCKFNQCAGSIRIVMITNIVFIPLGNDAPQQSQPFPLRWAAFVIVVASLPCWWTRAKLMVCDCCHQRAFSCCGEIG